MKFVEVLRRSQKLYSGIAQEFEVAVSTVEKWAEGQTAPHPKVQRLVIAHLLNEKQVPCNCEKQKQILNCPYHHWFEG